MKEYTALEIRAMHPDAIIDNSLISLNLELDDHGQFLLFLISAGRSRGFFLFLDRITRGIVKCLDLMEGLDSLRYDQLQRVPCRIVFEGDRLIGVGHLTKDKFIKFEIMDLIWEG